MVSTSFKRGLECDCDPPEDPITVGCGHVYCMECFGTLLARNTRRQSLFYCADSDCVEEIDYNGGEDEDDDIAKLWDRYIAMLASADYTTTRFDSEDEMSGSDEDSETESEGSEMAAFIADDDESIELEELGEQERKIFWDEPSEEEGQNDENSDEGSDESDEAMISGDEEIIREGKQVLRVDNNEETWC